VKNSGFGYIMVPQALLLHHTNLYTTRSPRTITKTKKNN